MPPTPGGMAPIGAPIAPYIAAIYIGMPCIPGIMLPGFIGIIGAGMPPPPPPIAGWLAGPIILLLLSMMLMVGTFYWVGPAGAGAAPPPPPPPPPKAPITAPSISVPLSALAAAFAVEAAEVPD